MNLVRSNVTKVAYYHDIIGPRLFFPFNSKASQCFPRYRNMGQALCSRVRH
jgi:hypothetical protein